MTDTSERIEGTTPGVGGSSPSATRPAGITARTVDAYASEHLRELADEVVDLKGALDGLRTTTETLAADLDWTQRQLWGLGRVVRVAMTIRRAARNPRSIPSFPSELWRALRAPLDPIRIPTRSAEGSRVAGEVRTSVAQAILERERNPSPVRRPRDLRVAIVADQRLIDGFGAACRIVELRPDHWREQLEAEQPDLLIVGSAWQGNGGAWRYRVATHAHPLSIGLRDLTAVTNWCTTHGVPTVFWNTEDPIRTDRFFEAASRVDWIFTVAPTRVDAYRAVARRLAAGVDVLAPAIQPRIHHPDRIQVARLPGALMADGGDPAWPLDRREALARLAATTVGLGLTILDPLLGEMPRGDLPPGLRALRRAGWPHDGPPVYSRFPVVLAPAASMEVIPVAALEAVACGTPVVMTAHRAAASALHDHVVCDDDVEVLRSAVERFATGDSTGRDAAVDGLRRAVRFGTYGDRLRDIARIVGISVGPVGDPISMLIAADDDTDLDRVAAAIAGQERHPDEIVIGASAWATGRRLQERLASSCPGLPVILFEQAAGIRAPASIVRLAAGATGTWLLVVDPRMPLDPALVDRHAALLQAGLTGSPDTLLERAHVLSGALDVAPDILAGANG